ncbi:hypothetical protein BZA05DRAFT_403050 [Tricharina praecox]|uniref:uncharacterized protein n=1 Tax=Tricharina praecox TaxID=43433 RepID=UPI00221F8381|nr:uncharacterized protein BZA05DRAFT_403050 [Tricharina praecox]KAI5848887.1 hypothetical protein BZA05DRAFT_403050 [Tricharina praecox]
MRFPTHRLAVLFVALTSLIVLATTAASPERDVDLLKRLIEPPKLSKRTPALLRRARFGCDNGYEQCPGLSYCCQAGLVCFSDGTCGSMSELVCYNGETACGSGTNAGCCPIKSSCVSDGKCVVNSGAVVKRFTGAATFGAGMGLSAAAAVVALC